MPQATNELRKQWPGQDAEAVRYLETRGFVLENWEWILPSKGYLLTDKEWSAVDYLVNEWDFGGLVAPKGGE